MSMRWDAWCVNSCLSIRDANPKHGDARGYKAEGEVTMVVELWLPHIEGDRPADAGPDRVGPVQSNLHHLRIQPMTRQALP